MADLGSMAGKGVDCGDIDVCELGEHFEKLNRFCFMQ